MSTPCKLGTQPAQAIIHGSDERRMAVGDWVRIKERAGDKWHRVLCTSVERDTNRCCVLYFTADR